MNCVQSDPVGSAIYTIITHSYGLKLHHYKVTIKTRELHPLTPPPSLLPVD